ncbi:MAG: hypothetical protein J5957_11965 [Prevotella sp.]|nr:hypothetical protein [Prevotella sp.]
MAEKEKCKKTIMQLVTKEHKEFAANKLKCIVQVSFPNQEKDPILLGSIDMLTNVEVCEFIKDMGISYETCNLNYWLKK